jgi:serine/threonine protein kinase
VKPERLGTLDRRLPAGYDVVAELGQGAAATVLHVRRAADGAAYALKLLDAVGTDPDAPDPAPGGAAGAALTAFRREAALLACVDHPGLVRIHEVGEVGGRPYLVMDLVEGESLGQLLGRGPLPPERVVALALDLVEPLTAVHDGGLVHRDLKPENIMIRPDGRARLIDFGLAAREAPAAGGTDDRADVAVGTLIYAPPEQTGMLRRPVDGRSDLYSLGVVLFECLTGAPPFTSPDVGELLRMHSVTPAPDLAELVPGIPPALAAAVAALLAKDPDDRYQHGAELAAGPAPDRRRSGRGRHHQPRHAGARARRPGADGRPRRRTGTAHAPLGGRPRRRRRARRRRARGAAARRRRGRRRRPRRL